MSASKESSGRLAVTVRRSRWLHGEGGSDSSLLRERDSKMCCLGFAALAAGDNVPTIVGQSGEEPGDAPALYMHFDKCAVRQCGNNPIADAMHINDEVAGDPAYDAKREAALIELGREKLGIDFTFVD